MNTPHQQSGGLEALIKEGTLEALKTPIYFAFDSEDEADEYIKELITESMTLAYEKGRADRDEEVRGIVEEIDAMSMCSAHQMYEKTCNICRKTTTIQLDDLLTALSPDVTKTEVRTQP